MPKVLRCLVAALLVAALSAPPAAAQPDTPVADPIPEKPITPGLTLTLEEFAAFPKTDTVPPPVDPRLVRWARVNYLGQLPDGRVYVPDLNGKLYFLKDGVPHVYLDVGAAFAPDFISGRGLGSGFGFVTFHPEFAKNGKFYTVHTEAGAALTTKTPDFPPQPNHVVQGVIDEWTATDPKADTFQGTRREVLRLGFGSNIHGIQQIDFNPTAKPGDEDYGLLYIAAGDGGRGVTTDMPQDLGGPYGKLLRIDPTDTSAGTYGIPATNPFVNREGALKEIYAVGMRDPHRFSWDPQAGNRMFLGHIGEHAIEAVYEVRAGDNFGWSVREGAFVFKKEDRCNLYTLPEGDEQFGFTYPVAAYDHDPPPGHSCTADSGHAIVGGMVYRGERLPALKGKYVFGDIVDGRVFFTEAAQMRRTRKERAPIFQFQLRDASGKRVTMAQLAGHNRVDLRFGVDGQGELYALSKANGKIWKITGARWEKPDVLPTLQNDLVAAYDFDHPVIGDPAKEADQGYSGTAISLVNGGDRMRVEDGAHPGSTRSMQAQQVEPATAGNDDWKAGIYAEAGVPRLRPFNAVKGVTIMGWFKMTGQNPSPNSNSANPDDRYGAIGLAGVLSGNSQGHDVRALLELITVNGEMRVVALGRRVDGGSSQTFAADEPWESVLPMNTWVFLAATFDYDTGAMALYKNGRALPGSYTLTGDPWGVEGEPEPDLASATDPRGIKIGGSYPQNTRENNPCNCRMDSLMFLDRVVSPLEIWGQYKLATMRTR
ncbi:PQQ-dependent sugar dehydrogenase [Nonomuraea africana]|uniref:Glucose/arabinose dehydrogenase n=1 Tax=Nonomuraea africana TaxID=46171 RepID=A0ABR9K8U0_9ACTN|nr:PQQ-dependent sugar dehydrogenase [Nonomuraea africana]MBE1558423.1 glucose/arabinose dehydrogenase [Nonomuraea africana]